MSLISFITDAGEKLLSQASSASGASSASAPAASIADLNATAGSAIAIKITKTVYGDSNAYEKIFDANKPMLKDPNKIYPGQQLRIPPKP